MNAFAAIQEALKPFGLPCVPGRYAGRENRYFEYNYANIRGGNFGDDRPECNLADVQVHLYLPLKENFVRTTAQVQAALFEAEFTWPSVRVMSEYDEIEAESNGERQKLDGIRHIVFECAYEETPGEPA